MTAGAGPVAGRRNHRRLRAAAASPRRCLRAVPAQRRSPPASTADGPHGLADQVARCGHRRQRQPLHAVQLRIEGQHLAALAPGAIQHHQPQLVRSQRVRLQRVRVQRVRVQRVVLQRVRSQRPRRIGFRRQQARSGFARRLRIQQQVATRPLQRRVQRGTEHLAGQQPAAGQAQVQQARTALGLRDLHRVLQDQHVDLVRRRHDPTAKAGASGSQASRAMEAFCNDVGRHVEGSVGRNVGSAGGHHPGDFTER